MHVPFRIKRTCLIDFMDSKNAITEPGYANTHLVAEETAAIGGMHANLGVLLGLFTLVLVAFIGGSGWPEWANNGWSILHIYAPFIIITLIFMIRLPVQMAGVSSKQEDLTHRSQYIFRTQRLTILSYYVLTIGGLMEIGAVGYLIQAHIRQSVPLAQNTHTIIAAYTISILFLVLIGGLWYVVWRLDKFHEEKVYTESLSKHLMS